MGQTPSFLVDQVQNSNIEIEKVRQILDSGKIDVDFQDAQGKVEYRRLVKYN